MAMHANGVKSKMIKEPLKYSGSLDKYKFIESTPIIGREYHDLQLTDLLKAPNRDVLVRDLAVTISRRGVCFFRNQDITAEGQKEIVALIGELAGKPKTSKLHIHPQSMFPDSADINDKGDRDEGIFVVSNKNLQKYRIPQHAPYPLTTPPASSGWHSDISFEHVPSDYACLKLRKTPETGGDTIWASSCEIYDRISPGLREYLCTLTAIHSEPEIPAEAKAKGYTIVQPRGAPENIGEDFEARHPVIRTNPVTGWRSVYIVGRRPRVIEGCTPKETQIIRDYVDYMITHNHDLQVRFKWNSGDVAIWDNRSVFHTATLDLEGLREGNRATSLGEPPYFDPASFSRRESLAMEFTETNKE